VRICLVSTIGYPNRSRLGGVPNCTRSLALALANEGHEVSVITGRREDGPFQENDGPVTVYGLPLGTLHYYVVRVGLGFGMWPRVLKSIEWGSGVGRFVSTLHSKGKLDVAVYSNVWIDALRHPKHIPYAVRIDTPIFAIRGVPGCGDQSGWGAFEFLERRATRKANAIICLTDSTAKEIRSEYKIAEDKTIVIPNPVDTDYFRPRQREIAHRPRIFHAGPRLNDWQKGSHILLEAMEQVIVAFPEAELFLAGSNPPSLEKQSEPLRRAIRVLGWLDSDLLAEQYAMADVTIVPSLSHEAFSLVCAESLASGTPVIGSSVGGIPDVVRHMETGLIVPPGDPRALGEAIVRILSDVPLLTRMRQRARQTAERGYSLESVGKKMSALCNRLVREHARAD
jgi:glycosyltransferase involved in cell wall biosynthesis